MTTAPSPCWFCGFWGQDGSGYCTGLWDYEADSHHTGTVLIQNKTQAENKVPQRERERERVNDKRHTVSEFTHLIQTGPDSISEGSVVFEVRNTVVTVVNQRETLKNL